jgi:hypothetical protein
MDAPIQTMWVAELVSHVSGVVTARNLARNALINPYASVTFGYVSTQYAMPGRFA